MRPLFLIPLMLLAASPAWAQEYAEQTYAPPQAVPAAPQQVSGNYVGQPVYAPSEHQAAPVQAPQPAHAAPAAAAAQPWDYGQSVATDIRQMNF